MNAPTQDTIDQLKKPIFILGFLAGYWRMLLLFVCFVVVGRIDAITYFVGPVFYLLEMIIGCMVAASFAKHIFYRQSIDAYTQASVNDNADTLFIVEWRNLSPECRVRYTVIVMCVLFLGASLIAANLAK